MQLCATGHADLDLRHARLMGILNATPDSFSDGGRYAEPARAAERARAMAEAGAAVIDVGGESTRPGARAVPADEQIRRAVPVVRAVRHALDRSGHAGVWIGIDTRLAPVAAAALDAGAAMVNDVSAGRHDPDLLPLVARRGCGLALMHMLGEPGTMQHEPRYDDVVGEVAAFLDQRVAAAEHAGVPRDRLVIDPGIGFGKTLAHNLALLARVDRLVATGLPVLVGASRKRFIAALDPVGDPDPDHRFGGTVAVTLGAAAAGASLIRVHDVPANAQALRVARAIAASSEAVSPKSSERR